MLPRRAGQYVRRRLLRVFIPAMIIVAVGIALVVGGFAWWPLSIAALVVLVALVRVFGEGRRHDPLPWLKGLRGEEAVARVLETLRSDGYAELHDVETGHGNIDHVVIGPTGVVAIETKHWAGRFMPVKGTLSFNGRPCSEPLGQVQRNAMDVKRRLAKAGISTFVDAVVVSTKAEVAKGELHFREADVVRVDRLADWIRSRRRRLTPDQVIRARAAILRWDATVTVRAVSHEG